MSETRMEELLETVAQNAEVEFKIFKNLELEKGKKEIFEDNYEIRFYDAIHEFLTSENLLQSDELEVISSESVNFIGLLYDYYLKNEHASITTWEDITDMISRYCRSRKG